MPDSIKLIEHGYVFTGDPQRRSGMFSILVRNDRIAEISNRGPALRAMYPNAEAIDASGKIIFPGFIDPHYHGESFLLRALTNRLPASKWSKDQDLASAFDFIHASATAAQLNTMYRLGQRAALRAGVTTLADAGMDTIDRTFGATLEAFSRSDMRGFVGLRNGDQIEHAKETKLTSVRFLLCSAGEEDLTSYNLQSSARIARESKWPLLLEVGETRKQYDILKRNFQKSPVQLLNEYRLFSQPLVLVHLSQFEQNDLELLTESRTPVLLSPSAIITKGADIPPLTTMINQGVAVGLCGDWGFSDPLANVRSLNALARTEGLQSLHSFSLLDAITRIPAAALGVLPETGSIEPGKKADITMLDASRFQLAGFVTRATPDELLRLVFDECSSTDVSEVMVNGEFYVREHTLLTYSEEDLAEESRVLFEQLCNAVGRTPEVLSQVVSSGNVFSADPAADADFPVEEGFRIIRKESGQTSAPILPLAAQRKPELSADVKKIFGEEEE